MLSFYVGCFPRLGWSGDPVSQTTPELIRMQLQVEVQLPPVWDGAKPKSPQLDQRLGELCWAKFWGVHYTGVACKLCDTN